MNFPSPTSRRSRCIWFARRYDVRVRSVYTIAVGAVAIVFAAMLQWLFLRQSHLCGAHLIFALHYVAFMYLLTIAVGASLRIGVPSDVAATVGYALLTRYLILALKRVYREPTGVILWKAGVVILLIIVLNRIANAVAIRLTLTLA
jgi:hypothetical protein